MANPLSDKILKFNNDTFESVRKAFNLDKPGSMEDAVDLFKAWLKKQEHFVKKDFSEGYLERMIIGSKGSVERAKGRLDKLCTSRTLMPHFFVDFDVKEFKHLDGKIYAKSSFVMIQHAATLAVGDRLLTMSSVPPPGILSQYGFSRFHVRTQLTSLGGMALSIICRIHVILPKLTRNNDRIFVAKYSGKQFNSKMVSDGFRVCLLLTEYFRVHDYSQAGHVIIDFRDASIGEIIKNINILELRQLAIILIEGYGIKIKSINLLTESKLIDALVVIVKQVLTDKLFSRVQVHKTLDSLFEVVPKEVLPKDLDGSERSFEDLNAQWMDILGSKDFGDYWKQMSAAKTDESLRQTDKFNDQYMGMPGTFRTLSVD